ISKVKLLYHSTETDLDQLNFKDGRIIERFSCPLIKADEPAGRVWSFRDITKARESELALKESEERFQQLSNASTEGIVIHDQGVMVECNKTAAEMFGYTYEEFQGLTLNDVMAEEYIAKVRQKMTEAYSEPFHSKGKRKNGELFPVLLSGRPITYRRQPMRVATVRDLSDFGHNPSTAGTSSAEFEAMLEQISDPAVLLRDGSYLFTNTPFHKLFGYDPENISRSLCFIDIVEEASRTDLLDWYQAQVDGCQVRKSFELNLVAEDGHQIPCEIRGTRMHFGGQPADLVIIRNLSQRSNGTKRDCHEDAKYRTYIESSPEAIFVANNQGDCLEVNQAASDITGFKREELLSMSVADLLVTEEKITPESDFANIWKDGHAYFEKACRRPDGSQYIMGINAVRIDDEQGIAFCADITAHRKTERELTKLSAAVNQSANAICITDTEGRIEYVNPSFCSLTGYAANEVVGRNPSVLNSGHHEESFFVELWDTIKSGETWTGQFQNRRSDGTLFWEHKTISPVFADDGEIVNFVAVGEDVTRDAMIQQKLIEADKLAAVGVLAAGVSHEFKNYLGGIIGNASFALEELDDPSDLTRDTLEQIISIGERANQVAVSLLTYSRARPEEWAIEDLKKVIEQTIKLVSRELQSCSVELVTYFEEIPQLRISQGKIQQLLLNLIINAEHAITADGVITIAMTMDEDWVTIKVGDTGEGIKQELLDKIFDPFFSTKGVWGKDKLAGSGMGLAICRNIAREHGGDLTVISRPGIGTTFALTLPISDQSSLPTDSGLLSSDVRNFVILSMERDVLRSLFNPACSARISISHVDSVAALQKNIKTKVDLVICDSRLPGKVELLKASELCRKNKVPYAVIYRGAGEYELSDIYDNAVACFEELPSIEDLSTQLRSVSAPERPAGVKQT
ncbi:MAG: PAS domain S-box protein, partial [candidate division Zixibacteria bacterium]